MAPFATAIVQKGTKSIPGTSSAANAGRNSQCHPSRFTSTAATAISSTSSAGANSTEKARLAIVPGYSHYNFVSATELAAIIDKYLADPLTNAPAGAAVASQAAPELTKSTSH
ncbi:MAG TPA: hypothetical protein VJX16_18400 [Terriglobales bacterium]|nr:hypothetical protein [Terriglobales bacterium]